MELKAIESPDSLECAVLHLKKLRCALRLRSRVGVPRVRDLLAGQSNIRDKQKHSGHKRLFNMQTRQMEYRLF